MAKRGVPTHPKTFRLARRLGVESWAAVGLLECFWHFCSVHAMTGVISADADELADAIRYGGDAAVLLEALVSCGWVDRLSDGRLVVHDAAQHADNTWKANLKRAGLRFWNEVEDEDRDSVTTESNATLEPETQLDHDRVTTESQQNHDSVTTQSQRSSDPPEPEPEPIPEPRDPPLPPRRGEGTARDGPVSGRKGAGPPTPIPENLDTPEFRLAWGEWLAHRRQIRRPVRPLTELKQLADLARHGPEIAVRAVEDSIRNGWQGLFPERVAARPPSGSGPPGADRVRRVAAEIERLTGWSA
ncbi:MAG: hypothetical protein KIS66_13710 [Fimbriimonadaceae bacterium]|nr:hypothetical protein [Fimbriimonadaceae bacterium]